MKTSKKDIEILERKEFLDTYSEFTKWIWSLGFRSGNYKENTTALDYHYSYYNEYIDALYGIEHYINDILNLSIRFLRDTNEHKIMFIGDISSSTTLHTIEQAKELILIKAKKIKTEQLSKLNSLTNI
jgi:hypothetical protein